MVGGRLGALLVAALVAAVLVPLTPAASATAPRLHTPSPAPGSMVSAGTVVLEAHVIAAEVDDVRWTIDGRTVDTAPSGSADPTWGHELRAVATVAAGDHLAEVHVVADGVARTRSWRFRATDRTMSRLAGGTRIDTAVEVSRASYPGTGSASAVVLARADHFADALAGAPLAAHVDGPLLLSDRDALPQSVARELTRLLPDGATVHLLGGTGSLSAQVAADVQALGYQVQRLAGADRYATAARIAALLPPSSDVIVASGVTFPDALAASVPAARDGMPILLTRPDALPSATGQFLADRDVARALVVGGPRAVAHDVVTAIERRGPAVQRIAGPDRYATAVRIAELFFEAPDDVALASGTSFPDALAGNGHASRLGMPLLLTAADTLPAPTDGWLRARQPDTITVYGGPRPVPADTAGAALRAAEDGRGAPAVTAVAPDTDLARFLDGVTVDLSEPVSAATVHLEIGGYEITGRAEVDGRAVTFHPDGSDPLRDYDAEHPARVVVAATDADGLVGHHEWTFTYQVPNPRFGTVGGVDLYLPSRDVELVGFHQSNHDGARQIGVFETATPIMTLPSRNRGTGSRSAADIVANPSERIYSPVTGRILRAGTYRLYCDYYDNYVVIEPDGHPGWEVKLLHFVGLHVTAGQRVTARETVLGDGPRALPFSSQVDEYSQPRDWPHVHLEVVDPSIPDRPGRGC